ncbi:MAG: hypothetical protein SGPRY_014125, partial [Prymnesium sp.]
MGMRRSSTYGLYTLLSSSLAVQPDEITRVTPWIVRRLQEWRKALAMRAGAPFTSAVRSLADVLALEYAPIIFFLRSDACKEGAASPGLGGAKGGAVWRYVLSKRELRLPIAVLEFAARFGEVAAHGLDIPSSALIVSEVDALTTTLVLTNDAANSPLMQHIHLRLQALPQQQAIADKHAVAHIYGEANVLADAVTRAKWDVARSLASQLGVALEVSPPPPELSPLLEELVVLLDEQPPSNALAQTSRGRHNYYKVGPPDAHDSAPTPPISLPSPELPPSLCSPPRHAVVPWSSAYQLPPSIASVHSSYGLTGRESLRATRPAM